MDDQRDHIEEAAVRAEYEREMHAEAEAEARGRLGEMQRKYPLLPTPRLVTWRPGSGVLAIQLDSVADVRSWAAILLTPVSVAVHPTQTTTNTPVLTRFAAAQSRPIRVYGSDCYFLDDAPEWVQEWVRGLS